MRHREWQGGERDGSQRERQGTETDPRKEGPSARLTEGGRHRPPVSQDSENHPLQSLGFLSCFLRWGSTKKAAPLGPNHPASPPEEE